MKTFKSTRATTTTRLFLAIALFAALAPPACSDPPSSPLAFAAPIIVDSQSDDDAGANGCTLRAAVMAANLDVATGGCTAGSGFDIIIVEATPVLSRNESLTIQSDIEIQGATPNRPIIGRSSSFVVERGASLSFRDIKLTEFTSTAVVVQGGGDFDEVFGGVLEMVYSEISGNGGGTINESPSIENDGGTVGVFSTIIQNNVGGIGGAAIRNLNGSVHIRDSSLIANVARQFGGAIQNVGGGFVSLSNVTISGNQLSGTDSSEGGGAIWNGRGSTVDIDFSTITANGAMESGAGIRNHGIMTIRRSIVSGNGGDCGGRSISSGGFNLVGDCPNLQMTATDISAQPRLAPLTDGLQGGDLNNRQRYHIPLSDSAAINAIPGSDCNAPFLDQRYRSRPSHSACEIGSIETD